MAGVTLLHKPQKGAALLKACEQGDIMECSRLIERDGVPANMSDDTRHATPLMVAAANSQDKIVKFLLIKGANPFTQDSAGWTALTWACWGSGSKNGRGWVPGRSKQTILAIVERMTINVTNQDKKNKVGGPESLLMTTYSGYIPLMIFVKNFNKKVDQGGAKKGAKVSKTDILKEQLSVVNKLIPMDALLARKVVAKRSCFGETVMQLARGKTDVKEIRRCIEGILRDLKVSEEQQKKDLIDGVDPPPEDDSKEETQDSSEKSKLLGSGGAESEEPGMLYCFTGRAK